MIHHSQPSLGYTLVEGRAFLEFGLCVQLLPILRQSPRGDGHPVVVYPGFMAANNSTQLLRWFLRSLGYKASGWCLGRNLGHESFMDSLAHQAIRLFQEHGQQISIIGWSLGGVYAREVARKHPECVRQVITLGSPFSAGPSGTRVSWLYKMVTGRTVQAKDLERFRRAIDVPTTAIYSQTDGIVNWRGCIEEEGPRRENIQVNGSHFGLGHNPAVLVAIADRLAQDLDHWKPFQPSALHAFLFPQYRPPLKQAIKSLTRRLIKPLLD